MLDRFAIDDGHHSPRLVIDEDASRAAGTARFRATCSCRRMPAHLPGSREEALAAHLAHVDTRLGPSRGPAWLPFEARLALLVLGCLGLFGGCLLGATTLAGSLHLAGDAALGARAGGVLAGFVTAGSLMVSTRHYMAPTRD
ncbi:hypothetical protein ACH4U6_34900 [Streptomyces netropsis]|uniref:hypothetical protein n=1 Tax=Streptomyces netropsis TaxID=55404 RepID=UPI0037A6E9A8